MFLFALRRLARVDVPVGGMAMAQPGVLPVTWLDLAGQSQQGVTEQQRRWGVTDKARYEIGLADKAGINAGDAPTPSCAAAARCAVCGVWWLVVLVVLVVLVPVLLCVFARPGSVGGGGAAPPRGAAKLTRLDVSPGAEHIIVSVRGGNPTGMRRFTLTARERGKIETAIAAKMDSGSDSESSGPSDEGEGGSAKERRAAQLKAKKLEENEQRQREREAEDENEDEDEDGASSEDKQMVERKAATAAAPREKAAPKMSDSPEGPPPPDEDEDGTSSDDGTSSEDEQMAAITVRDPTT